MSMDDNGVRDPRIANLDVVRVWNEKTGLFEAAHTENISRSGLFIITNNPLKVGSEVRLKFTIATYAESGENIELMPVDVHGKVIRAITGEESGAGINPGMGITFIDLPEETLKAIDGIIRTGLETTQIG